MSEEVRVGILPPQLVDHREDVIITSFWAQIMEDILYEGDVGGVFQKGRTTSRMRSRDCTFSNVKNDRMDESIVDIGRRILWAGVDKVDDPSGYFLYRSITSHGMVEEQLDIRVNKRRHKVDADARLFSDLLQSINFQPSHERVWKRLISWWTRTQYKVQELAVIPVDSVAKPKMCIGQECWIIMVKQQQNSEKSLIEIDCPWIISSQSQLARDEGERSLHDSREDVLCVIVHMAQDVRQEVTVRDEHQPAVNKTGKIFWSQKQEVFREYKYHLIVLSWRALIIPFAQDSRKKSEE